jgi:hypothetical protein
VIKWRKRTAIRRKEGRIIATKDKFEEGRK